MNKINNMNWFKHSASKILYIARGLPGSGKSFLAKQLAPKENIFSTDDFWMQDGEYKYDQQYIDYAHWWNKNRVEDAMQSGMSPVVIDNTNVKSEHFRPYVILAKKYGYEIKLVEPDTPWKFDVEELAKRNTHKVPKENIKKMLDEWEVNPDLEKVDQ